MTIEEPRLHPDRFDPEWFQPPCRADDGPTLFHSQPWREAVEESFEVDIRRFTPAAPSHGHAFYSVVDDIRGPRVISTPFSDFCDPCLDSDGWKMFVDHLRAYELPITIRPFVNPVAVADRSFEQRTELLWHAIDLSEGLDPVWDGLKTKLRTSIRRAAKQGITFRVTNARRDLELFHEMHVGLRKTKYRLLAQPFSFFAALQDRFSDDFAIVMAEDKTGPVAAMVYLAWNETWYYKFGASVPRPYRPNAALLTEACREGAERGLQLLDLGRSDIDQPGLVSFKQSFASVQLPLTTLHWAPDSYRNPRGEAAGSTIGAVTDLLTAPDVPDEITKQGGDLLYRFFA